jgi:AcrR family transcriptional regulator
MPNAVEALLSQSGPSSRADAQRNVERLVAAARAALADAGLDLTTRDVAARAGVGLGTLYRRIPSLDALLTAILIDTIDEMTNLATHALEDTDPWRGFADFAEAFVQLRACSCGLHDALAGSDDPDLTPQIDQLRLALRRLIQRTQRAGAIRDDLDWRDIPFVLASAIPADHTIGLHAKPDQWQRNLRIILAGLRPAAATQTQMQNSTGQPTPARP